MEDDSDFAVSPIEVNGASSSEFLSLKLSELSRSPSFSSSEECFFAFLALELDPLLLFMLGFDLFLGTRDSTESWDI